MSAMTRAHNPTPYEVVVDSEGHILPGHTTMTINPADKVTGRLILADRLTVVPETAPASAPAAEAKTRKKPAPAAPAVAEDGE